MSSFLKIGQALSGKMGVATVYCGVLHSIATGCCLQACVLCMLHALLLYGCGCCGIELGSACAGHCPPTSLLAARPDLLPKPYLDALSELQDRLPSFPSSIAFEVGLQGENPLCMWCGRCCLQCVTPARESFEAGLQGNPFEVRLC